MSDEKEKQESQDSVIGQLESQLNQTLAIKKEEISRILEERIKAEQNDAKRRIDEIEQEFSEEKKNLNIYREMFTELETNRIKMKKKIKSHLEKAVSFQSDIVELTGKTLEELKIVNELSQQLETFEHEIEGKMAAVQKELETKYGIKTPLPNANGADDIAFDLEQELSKLHKIKELLGKQAIPEEAIHSDGQEPETGAGEFFEPAEVPDETAGAGGDESEPPAPEIEGVPEEFGSRPGRYWTIFWLC